MDTQMMMVLAAVAVAVLALGLWAYERRRRTQALRQTFGDTYDHVVSERGRREAEAHLVDRKLKFEKANIRPLSAGDRDRYLELWRGIQARFVDNPTQAVGEADFLCQEVMRVRGYPTADPDQRLADVAIGHPEIVDHYRTACEVAHRGERANTEELRQAVVHYRALFDDLLAVHETEPALKR